MIRKVLVPVDGSDTSRTILRWATGLARSSGASIVLLSVVDPEDITFLEAASAPISDGSDTPDKVLSEIVAKTKTSLEDAVAEVEQQGVEATLRVVSGSPAEKIVSEAESIGVDLIAMATRRESALARGVLGSVTDRVLHSTGIPLLALQPEEASAASEGGLVRRIVVPLDGSELAENAVPLAVSIAKVTGAKLDYLRLVRLPIYGVDMGGVGYGSVHYAETLDTEVLEKEASEYLTAYVENAESAGVKAQAIVGVGNAALRIVDEVGGEPGTIVVMATRGAGGLKRWVVGSVADKVVRSAHVPVLVIPPTK
jgi:nucleotide-binding universal stress UspA family protein